MTPYMDAPNDPRPLHLDLYTVGGILLAAVGAILAASGHPLSAEWHEAILGALGAAVAVVSIVMGRIHAHRSRRSRETDDALTSHAAEILALLRNVPADSEGLEDRVREAINAEDGAATAEEAE